MGKVALVLMCLLNKVAEINAFRNPNAESIYTSLKENGMLANSKFSDTGTTLTAAKSKLSFVYFLKSFLPLALRFMNTLITKRHHFASRIGLQYKTGHRISPTLISSLNFNTCA